MARIDEVPAGVDAALWRGNTYAPPAVGDLWSLSWDHEALGLAVICGIAPDYFLVWPVSLFSDAVFSPALEVDPTPLDVPLAIWPTRETGIGTHLLDRRLGTLMSSRTMALTQQAMETGTPAPLPWATPNVEPDELELADDAMVDSWEAICIHTWPHAEVGISALSAESLNSVGLSVADLVRLLELDSPEAVALYRGEQIPTADQVQHLAAAAATEAPDLLQVSGDVLALASPQFKMDLLEVSDLLGRDEESIRNLVRAELALAARSDGNVSSRVLAAIDRVRQRGGA